MASGADKDKRGVYLPYTTDKGLELLKTFNIREDDIIVACYPRSGTNWLKEIVSCIMLDGDTEKAKSLHIQLRIPSLEPYPNEDEGAVVPLSVFKQGNVEGCTADEGDYLKELDELPSPRIFGSHIKFHHQPPGVQQGKCKVVVMIRNPKDVAVSQYCLYNQHAPLWGPAVSWEEAIEDFTHGKGEPYGRWVDHVIPYWEAKNTVPIKFVTYENGRKDLVGLIKEVAEFIGKDLSDAAVERIREHVEYSHMKKNPNANPMCVLGENYAHEKSHYMRKGKVGDWKNYFTVAQSEEFDKVYHQYVDKTDIKMEFDV